MSLFGPVYVILSLSKRESDAVTSGAAALVGIDASLKAMLAKADDPNTLTPEQLVALTDLNASQAAKATAVRAALTAVNP